MAASVLISGLILVWAGIVYAWLLEARTRQRPYRSVVARSVLVAVVMVLIELVLMAARSTGPLATIATYTLTPGFLLHLTGFALLYLVARRAPLQPVWAAVTAGLDWAVAGHSFQRSYRRRRAGQVFRGILDDAGIGRHR